MKRRHFLGAVPTLSTLAIVAVEPERVKTETLCPGDVCNDHLIHDHLIHDHLIHDPLEAMEYVRSWVAERPDAYVLSADDHSRRTIGWSAFRLVEVNGERLEEAILVRTPITSIAGVKRDPEVAELLVTSEGRCRLAANLMVEGRRRAGYSETDAAWGKRA